MTINRERIRELRDHIADLPADKLNMRTWSRNHSCDTAACIGGWAERLFVTVDHPWSADTYDALGLTGAQGTALCYPEYRGPGEAPENPYSATPTQAARVLDILDKTGEVRWDLAMAEALEPA